VLLDLVVRRAEYGNKGGSMMPFIKLEGGKIDKVKKEELISELTRVASETLGIPEDAFIVLIKENEMDNWGTGGKVLSKVLAERENKK